MARRRAGTARRDQRNELGVKLAAHAQRQLIDDGETFAADSPTMCRPPPCWCGSRSWSNSARILGTSCSTASTRKPVGCTEAFSSPRQKAGASPAPTPTCRTSPSRNRFVRSLLRHPASNFVVADYSQLELRVMAHIANDDVMTEAYRKGLDLHAVTAAGMLGLKPDEFDPEQPAHKEARQKAKAVNFGVIFGSGPSGLREFARDAYNLQITMEEARAVIDRFLATYPGVARWQREQEARTRQTRTVATKGGRVYRFAWEPSGEYSRNLALNLPIQGTAAEIAIEALIRIDARLRAALPGKAQIVLQVHDEFVVEAEGDEAVVLATKSIVEEAMIAAFEALLPGAPTKGLVTAHSGPTWAAAKR